MARILYSWLCGEMLALFVSKLAQVYHIYHSLRWHIQRGAENWGRRTLGMYVRGLRCEKPSRYVPPM